MFWDLENLENEEKGMKNDQLGGFYNYKNY